ncbi:MAG TPA: hypothetical protein VGQ10_17885 [Vicinamibacterales bacterium]|jgi:hypothetical protein|nr:hypothetical protein [Vicinamibacterales bacterium]
MRCPFGSRGLGLLASLLLAAFFTAACSGGTTEAGSSGTTGGSDKPFLIAFEQTYMTIENRSGSPIVSGTVAIMTGSLRPPFTMALPRLENLDKRDFPLRNFRGNDGTEFSRRVAKAQRIRITAVDVAGKKYEMEMPVQ